MFELRLMEEKDLDTVAELEKQIFSLPWSKQGFLDALKQESSLYLTVYYQKELAGYCGLLQSFEEADITNVAVAEKFRGKGVASKMLQELLLRGNQKGIQNFTLEVRVSNHAAIHLYKKLGFESIGVRPNFYEKPKEDAMIMWKYAAR